MSEERIITAATITTGEKIDGKQLEELIEKNLDAGMEIETVIGDTAYSEKAYRIYERKQHETRRKIEPIYHTRVSQKRR